MSVVIRLKVPIEMHYTVIPMGTSKVNSSQNWVYRQPKTGFSVLKKDRVTRFFGCGKNRVGNPSSNSRVRCGN